MGYALRMRNQVCLYLNLDAVYSGSVWIECVELDDKLFLADEGESLCLSILEYFYFGTVFFSLCFNYTLLLSIFNVSLFRLLSITIYLKLSFGRIFEKMKLYPFHRGKVDSLFVVVGGSYICYRCVYVD